MYPFTKNTATLRHENSFESVILYKNLFQEWFEALKKISIKTLMNLNNSSFYGRQYGRKKYGNMRAEDISSKTIWKYKEMTCLYSAKCNIKHHFPLNYAKRNDFA